MLLAILGVVIGVVLGSVLGALLWDALKQRREKDKLAGADASAARIIAEAQTKEKEALLEAKEEAIRIRGEAENEARERRQEVLRLEQRVLQKEENLERKVDAVDRRDRAIGEREKQLDEVRAKLEDLQHEKVAEIERVAHLTTQEARDVLMAEIEGEVRDEANRLVAHDGDAGTRGRRPCAPVRSSTSTIQRIVRRGGIRIHRHGRADPERGHEGPDHRPRGAQYPRPGARHRHRPDHRRHAGRGHALGLRRRAARGGAAGADAPDFGRAHPPDAHRGGGGEVPQRGRERAQDCRRRGGAEVELPRPAP